MSEEIAVSVICNAYNHEKYIRSALEGFVMQKTNFPFEVLVHDDASTDNTPNIIREYEKKYPDLIKPIYQTVNQYSQGISIGRNYQYPRIKGKYVAVCEGDDYWIDPLKLQKQFDALEQHPEVDICAHATYKERNGKRCGVVAPAEKNVIFTVEDVILGGGGFVMTASLMYRAYLTKERPEFRKNLPLDYTLQIQGALRGGMLYLNDRMSVYRLMTDNSWTRRMAADFEKRNTHNKKISEMLEILNEETDYKYDSTIRYKIKKNNFSQLKVQRDYKTLISSEYKEIFHNQPLKTRIKIIIGARCPFLLKILQR